jgi:hypothetical protein
MIRTEKFPTFFRVFVYDDEGIRVIHKRDWPLTYVPMMAIAETIRGVRTPPVKTTKKYIAQTLKPIDENYPVRTKPRYRGPFVHDDDCLCDKCVAMRAEPERVTTCKTKPTKKQIELLVGRFRTS